MTDLIAWMRSVPPSRTDHPGIVTGPAWKEAVAGVRNSAMQAARLATRVPVDAGPSTAKGRYLTQIACAECHGPTLTGVPEPKAGDAPDLSVAAAYERRDFVRLMRTGLPPDGPGLDDEEARHWLHALGDANAAIQPDYLIARARH
ncbi:c-type cytochrome [Sphingomonas sp. MMS24-JH45]